uniref:DUF1294 domain-containing protein n=1 Tax=Agathobacter sp. TaxID=2021311 RepID=UPI0040569712
MEKIVIVYVILINLAGFLTMSLDKERAKRKAWRIPEKTLFMIALLGGSIGAWAGMYAFRHKTRHWYFKFGMPMILLVQAVCAYYVLVYL